jgi:mono/diheme cytochrome c family protein
MRPAIITLVVTTALFAAGCGAVAHLGANAGNPSVGKALFIKTCSGCHTLADAHATGTVGPNLDDAFRYVKLQGFHQSTIRDVVRGQIAYATSDPRTVYNGQPVVGMPDNLLRGQQAADVAVYVAQCSANPHCGVQASSG